MPPAKPPRIFAVRSNGSVVECPKGIPHDAVCWCFEGDSRWSPPDRAGQSGLSILKAPKALKKRSAEDRLEGIPGPSEAIR